VCLETLHADEVKPAAWGALREVRRTPVPPATAHVADLLSLLDHREERAYPSH
jgi:hypothetical protein